MRLAIIVEKSRCRPWQLDALRQLSGHEIVLVLNCQNTEIRRDLRKHFLYYALNFVSVRSDESKTVEFSDERVEQARTVDFDSEYAGIWQSLPQEVIDVLNEEAVDAIVKFGMSLLTVPGEKVMDIPILSYHHGDPARYRGRPAGFYELQDGADSVGVIVQRLSNVLDGGEILAKAEVPLVNHSYKQTLAGALKVSRYLLPKALDNLETGKRIEQSSDGTNYRLPANSVVIGFAFRRATAKLRRLAYGLFLEKKWMVSVADTDAASILEGNWPAQDRTLPLGSGHAFLADPFLVGTDRILVEAVSKRTNKGQLVLFDGTTQTDLTDGNQHFSYPCVVHTADGPVIVPEIAGWSAPMAFPLSEDALGEPQPLKFSADTRITDPTVFHHAGDFFMFGSRADEPSYVLRLWYADELGAEWIEHPQSPIVISPKGGRMAGQIQVIDGRLIRLGQDFCGQYGDGIWVAEISDLSRLKYEESVTGIIRLGNSRGPHTLNSYEDQCVWDWYEDRFSIAAGIRRLSRA